MKSVISISMIFFLLSAGQARSQIEPAKAYNIRIYRSDMPDITDLPSLVNSITYAGMPDADRAKAVWRVIFQYSHQDAPPQELIDQEVHEPIKLFNVYGYRMCCCAATCLQAIGAAAGLQGRIISINIHRVAELYYDDAWHMFDSSFINYYKKDNGVIASVADICDDVEGLINPEHCPFFDAGGCYPAGTHCLQQALDAYGSGWDVNRGHKYSLGYRCLLTLREGETLLRSCSNLNQEHVNKDGAGSKPETSMNLFHGAGDGDFLDDPIPDQPGTFYYFHPDYHGGIVGNGTLTYQPDLAGGGFRRGIESEHNIAWAGKNSLTPAVHPATGGEGWLIFRMSSPYVFLAGEIEAVLKCENINDKVELYISTNNQLDWHKVYSTTSNGTFRVNIDIGSYIYRRYSYHLKFVLSTGGSLEDVGIDSLTVSNLIQHAQRAMPFLVQGNNEFSVDTGPAISTLTIAPRLTTATVSPDFYQNETLTTMHADISGMWVYSRDLYVDNSGQGSVTFPVSTPGEIIALRMGGVFMLIGPNDRVEWQLSTTGPNSGFSTIHQVRHSDKVVPDYFIYEGLPASTRNVWVRIKTYEVDEAGIVSYLRIDADYREHGATRLPFNIKHQWTENGIQMEHTELITTVPHRYSINCVEEPEMTALTIWVDNSDQQPGNTPKQTVLYQNYPNPFNSQTTLSFYLPIQSRVRLTVYDVSGSRIRTLLAGDKGPGQHQVPWDGRDRHGSVVGSGIYIYRLETEAADTARKAVFLK